MNNLEHIAIIMDGNGRWAKEKGLPRTAGHKKGVETVREIARLLGGATITETTLESARELIAGSFL